ncbi:MAG: lysophospholipid acyltransferase family protein [Burkholderiaceae bacterium]
MQVLRALVFGVFQTVSLIFWAILFMASAPFLNQPRRYRLAMQWPRMVIYAARTLLGIHWKIKGQELLDACANQPVIVCAKHQSSWETFFLPSFMPRQLCFVFKKELLAIPFFGWSIRLLDMVHINRSQGKEAYQQIASQAQTKFAEGRWMVFFPEGTRTPPGHRVKYKSGAARLAIGLDTPILPIALNSGLLWSKNAFLKNAGCITVSIGPLIFPQPSETPEAVMARVETWIEEETQRMS